MFDMCKSATGTPNYIEMINFLKLREVCSHSRRYRECSCHGYNKNQEQVVSFGNGYLFLCLPLGTKN